MKLQCPHCRKSIGGPAREGGTAVRLRITVIADDGSIHGPCPECRQDVVIADGATISKALIPSGPRIVLRVPCPKP